MISAGPSLLALRVAGSAHILRIKQSSPLIFFSPMHLALVNMLAVVLGSRPWDWTWAFKQSLDQRTACLLGSKMSERWEASHLKCTAQGSNRTFSSMCTKPRCMPPHKLPIAAGMNLASTKRKLNIPHIWIHLPQDKPTRLCSFGRVPIFSDLVSRLKFWSYHPHLPHSIRIVNGILKPLPSWCCCILL